MGWVQRRRDLGQLLFIALRDRTGIVQIVVDGNTAEKTLFEKAETVRSEFVLAVKGKVSARTDGNINENMKTGKIEITSQNHSYAVDVDSLKDTPLELTHKNLLDNTAEGVEKKIFSVQYHPESAPGPQDSAYLFDKFISLMQKGEE